MAFTYPYEIDNKLQDIATLRTIKITGGATGTSTPFDITNPGTTEISIPLTIPASGVTRVTNSNSKPGAAYILGDASLSISGNTITLSRTYQVDQNTVNCSTDCGTPCGCSGGGPSQR